MELHRRELVIIAGFLVFGLVWAFGVLPSLTTTPWFVALNPVAAYVLYNLGFIIIVSLVFGGMVSFFLGGENEIFDLIRTGLAGWLLFSGVFDLLQPPLYLSTSGQVLIPLGTASLENVAVDAMFAYVWRGALGNAVNISFLGVSLWFILVYLITPIIAILIAAILLAPRRFVSLFSRGPVG